MKAPYSAHQGILAQVGGSGTHRGSTAVIAEEIKVYLGGVLTATASEPGSSGAIAYVLKEEISLANPVTIQVPRSETVTPVVTSTPTITESVNATVIGIYLPLPPETVVVASGLSFAGVNDSVTMDLQTTIFIPLSETVTPVPVPPTITESVTPTLH